MHTKIIFRFLYILITNLLLNSCIEKYEVPVRNETPRLVIEGMLTNESPPYFIKLSYSNGFNNSFLSNFSAVAGADIILKDDLGLSVSFEQTPYYPGIYKSNDSAFVGTVGRSYILSVTLPDGRKYVSKSQQMKPTPPLDSLYAVPDSQSRPLGDNNVYGYSLYVDFKEPGETTDYYRWSSFSYVLKQGKPAPCVPFGQTLCTPLYWCFQNENQVHILSDDALNGKTIRKQYVHFSPVFVLGQNLIEVTQQSLTREMYQFWKRYQDQISRTGSIFDPLPSTIEGNIVNAENPADLALGYFGVSAVIRKKLVINTTLLPRGANIIAGYGNSYTATTCPDQSLGSTDKPSGW